jgi:DNA topoisomerase-1
MAKFWGPFKELVEDKKDSLDKTDAGSVRVLGTDVASGKPISARIGRFGPMVQIGTVEDEEKPRFASLRPGQSIYTITQEEALKLFEMPRLLGEDKGEQVSVGIGRFGPFAKRGSTYASLKKEDDPYSVDLAHAVFLIEEKEEIARNRVIKHFPDSDIQVLNGRFGPYISDGNLNGKIPKDREPASLTLAEVQQLLADTGKPARKGFGAKKAAKKAAKAAVAKDDTAKKSAAKKTATKKAPAKKAAAKKAVVKAVAKEVPAERPAFKKPAKKTVVKKTAA